MAEFLAELRRRHIFRIGGIYVVVAWGIAQVIDFLSQVFALPDWVAQPVAIVLAIGFPVVLIASWLVIGAAKATDTPAELKKATLTDWALIAAFAVVIVLISYQRLSPTDPAEMATVAMSDEAALVAGDIVEEVADRLSNSIAVLPLENLSPDPDNAYFALGVHEEIINQLSKLRNVNVIARNSVMQYEGGDVPIPEIAEQLNVETVMRGSVRYAGNQVRVTAQLIDGMTNLPVWTTEDEGDLSDIFAIQSDIAMSIANSLQAQYSAEEQESIERQPTDSPEALEAYLRAKAVVRTDIFGGQNLNARSLAQQYLDEALEFDPEFALAYAWKARVYNVSKRFDPITEAEWLSFSSEMSGLVQENLDRALALDQNIGLAHIISANNLENSLRFEEAQIAADRALESSPNDPDVLFLMSFFELDVRGRPDIALQYSERALEIDPRTAQRHNDYGDHLRLMGEYSRAVESYQNCLVLNPADTGCSRNLAITEFLLGDREAALRTLRQAEAGGGGGTLSIVAWGYGRLEQPEEARRVFARIQSIAAEQYVDPTRMAKAYLGIGDYDEALRLLRMAADNPELIKDHVGKRIVAKNEWHDPILEQPEFIEVRERLLGRSI